MNMQATKLEIIRLLLETDNKELVDEIKKVFQKQGKICRQVLKIAFKED
jgi:hypothetical protein